MGLLSSLNEGINAVGAVIAQKAAEQHAANQWGDFETRVANLVDASNGPSWRNRTKEAKRRLELLGRSENEAVSTGVAKIMGEMKKKEKLHVYGEGFQECNLTLVSKR